MDILIAGCGYVGQALAHRLVADGHRVRALRRSDSPLPAGVIPIRADLANASSLRDNLPQTIEAVVYCAAAKSFDDRTYKAIYVDGLRNLLDFYEAAAKRPSRFLFTSSTGVYGQMDGEWVDEHSETRPGNFSGQRLLEGEQRLADSPIPSVALRLGGIYGPGRTGALSRAGDKARLGITPNPPGVTPQYTNRIHRDDCAAALAHLLTLADPLPVYNGVDHEPTTDIQVIDWLRQRGIFAQSPPPHPPLAPIRRSSNKRCRNQSLINSGYSFSFPTFREGFESLWPELQGNREPA